MMSAVRSSVASVATGLPWCCIAPAVFSVFGAGVAGAGAALNTAMPLFLVVSLGFLARALYLSLVQRRGPFWVRIVTLTSAVAVALVWGFRFGVWST